MLPEEDLRLCLAQSPCIVSILSREGVVLFTSMHAYGYQPSDLEGFPSDKPFVPEDSAAWWRAFYQARDCREVVDCSLKLSTAEPPRIIDLEGRLFPVVDLEGGSVKHIGCLLQGRACTSTPPGSRDLTFKEGELPTPPPLPRPGHVPADALWLSPMNEAVLAFLARRHPGWSTAAAIARAIGETVGHRFRAGLTTMVDRKLIEAASGSGYRLRSPLPPPSSSTPT